MKSSTSSFNTSLFKKCLLLSENSLTSSENSVKSWFVCRGFLLKRLSWYYTIPSIKRQNYYYLVTSKSRCIFGEFITKSACYPGIFLKKFDQCYAMVKTKYLMSFKTWSFSKRNCFQVNLSTYCLLIHESDQWKDSWENIWEIEALYHFIFLVDKSTNSHLLFVEY